MNLASILDLLNNRAQAVAVVDANGDQITDFSATVTFPASPANATLSNVTASATSVSLLAANVDRRQFRIHNASGKVLYVAFGATATTTAFSILVAANADYESPMDCYTGAISGIWNGTGGAARITEVTV